MKDYWGQKFNSPIELWEEEVATAELKISGAHEERRERERYLTDNLI